MKAIMVMFDSLNRHMLPPYGCEWTHAPNFKRLAEHTVTFDRSFIGSMPCMPARRDLHTGRYNFLHRSWGPLEPFDDSFVEMLNDNGIYTHLTSDHYHYWEDGGATYHNRYQTWELARGQEGDPFYGQVKGPEIPETYSTREGKVWRQDWINRPIMDAEYKQPQPQTFASGIDFIRRNKDEDNWFLQIEAFDPHEPFFTQQHYKDLYPHEYDGPHFDWPNYAPVTEPREAVQHMRYEYAALLTMCDRYLGKVLALMDKLNLWDDTMLIVCTDHGFLLGEHDWWAKMVSPFYNEVAHTPLFIWDPRSKRQHVRTDQLAQLTDIGPTLLEFFGIDRTPDMCGVPLGPTLADDSPSREAILFGQHGSHVCVTDGRYIYMRAPVTEDNTPLYHYTMMPTHMNRRFSVEELQDVQLAAPFSFTKGCRTLKIPGRTGSGAIQFGTLLYDIEADPEQHSTLDDPEVESRMIAHLVRLMKETDAPPEQFERLGLVAYV